MPNSIVASTTSTFYTDITNMLRFSYADGIDAKDLSAIFAWGVNKVGQSAAIADVWAALNNNGKTLDSTVPEVAGVNPTQVVFCSVRTFFLGIPFNYGPDLMADLLQLGIKIVDSNNATIVDFTTYQGMIDFEAYNTANPALGVNGAPGRFVFSAANIVSTRQNFGTTLQNTPYVNTNNTNSGITYLPNTYGWLWSALGGSTFLTTDASLVTLVRSTPFGTGPNAISIFSAFRSLIPSNLVSVSLFENAGVPLVVLLSARDSVIQSPFVDTNYKTGSNGSKTSFDAMHTLITSYPTVRAAYVLLAATDLSPIYSALQSMGYQQSDLIASTVWSTILPSSTPNPTSNQILAAQSTLTQLDSSFKIFSGTLSQRMSFFGYYKSAVLNALGNASTAASTCSLTISMTMVKSADLSDSVFSNILANLTNASTNPTKGYITLNNINDYATAATGLTLPAIALSGSNLVAFSFARIFSQITSTAYTCIDSTSVNTLNFKPLVSTSVISQIATGFFDNSAAYNSAVSGNTALPLQIVALTSVDYVTITVNAPFSTSSFLRSSLIVAVIKASTDISTYIISSTTKNSSSNSGAFTDNIASGVYSSSSIQQNVASIWNYPVPTAASGSNPVTIYGANPKLSLLSYIVASATTGNNSVYTMPQLDRATLMSYVVSLVNNDASLSAQTNQVAFFTNLISVSTALITGLVLPTGANSLAIEILVNYMLLVPSMQSDVSSLLNKVLPLASLNTLPGGNANSTANTIATDLRTSVFASTALDAMASVGAWNAVAITSPASSTATFNFPGQVLEQIQVRQLSTFFGSLLDQSIVCGLKNVTTASNVTTTTYSAPGLWLSFLNKSLNLAAMGYPLGNILSVTYTKSVFAFDTGFQIGTPMVVQLIPGSQAVAWGYSKADVLTYNGNVTGSV